MRLAGTCNKYSKNAIPQLISAAITQGLLLSSFKCAYHAKVINTLLQVNAQQQVIADGLQQAAATMRLSPDQQRKLVDSVSVQEREFNAQLIDAFTSSLHRIFIISSALMAIGFVVVIFIKERPLRGGVKVTPGE